MSWIDDYEYVPVSNSNAILTENQLARATVEVYIPGVQGPAGKDATTMGVVCFNIPQDISQEFQEQARVNIGAAPSEIPDLLTIYLNAKNGGSLNG